MFTPEQVKELRETYKITPNGEYRETPAQHDLLEALDTIESQSTQIEQLKAQVETAKEEMEIALDDLSCMLPCFENEYSKSARDVLLRALQTMEGEKK